MVHLQRNQFKNNQISFKMNKRSLLNMLVAGLFCIALFTQCGETKKAAEDTAKTGAEMADEAADKAGDMANEAADKAGDMAEDMKDTANEALDEMDSKAGELSFEAGSWASNLLQGVNSGSSMVFTLDQIPFEGEELSAEGTQQLDNLAAILKANPDWNAEIQGHTSKAQKVGNGGVRAKWVQTKLVVGRGVPNKQLSSKGYGTDNLLPDVPEDDDKQKRITVSISK